MVAHTFNPSTWQAEQVDLSEFEVSLVYKASSRTVRTVNTEKPCLKNKTKQTLPHQKKPCNVFLGYPFISVISL